MEIIVNIIRYEYLIDINWDILLENSEHCGYCMYRQLDIIINKSCTIDAWLFTDILMVFNIALIRSKDSIVPQFNTGYKYTVWYLLACLV